MVQQANDLVKAHPTEKQNKEKILHCIKFDTSRTTVLPIEEQLSIFFKEKQLTWVDLHFIEFNYKPNNITEVILIYTQQQATEHIAQINKNQ